MKDLINLVRIAKSSVLHPFLIQGLSPSEVINYATELQKSKKKQLLISEELALKEVEKSEKLGIKIISIQDELYPVDLKTIHNPPVVLYLKGNLDLLAKPKFAIVGARAATAESRIISESFAKSLSEFGFKIVSGFAFGVDSSACIGALNFGTIQVFGSGIDVIYPDSNTMLYKQVLENGGLFISEVAPGSPARPENFPLRNRIIVGLSKAVLLVQASKKNGSSGSLITAKITLDQEKELFAIPGHPLDPRFDGGNYLIKHGNAIFTTTPQDVIEMIGYHLTKKQPQITFKPKKIDFEIPDLQKPSLTMSDEICTQIKSVLGTHPVSVEEISQMLAKNVRDVQIAITQLELAEEVRKHFGGKFSLNLI